MRNFIPVILLLFFAGSASAQVLFSVAAHENSYVSLAGDAEADSINPYIQAEIPLDFTYTVHGISFDHLKIRGFSNPELIARENNKTHYFLMQVQAPLSSLTLGRDSRIYSKVEGQSGEKVLTLELANWVWPEYDSVPVSCQYKFYEKDRKIEFLYGPNGVTTEVFAQMGDSTVLYLAAETIEGGPSSTFTFWYSVDHVGQNLSLKVEFPQFGIIRYRPLIGNGYVFYYQSPTGIGNENKPQEPIWYKPVSEGLYMIGSTNKEKFNFTLVGSDGREIQRSNTAVESTLISMQNYPSGIYQLRVVLEDGTHQLIRLLR